MKRLILALAVVVLCGVCCSCLSVYDAKVWASEVSMEADIDNPKLTLFYGCGTIVAVDGVEGSGRMTKRAEGPTTRPATQ